MLARLAVPLAVVASLAAPAAADGIQVGTSVSVNFTANVVIGGAVVAPAPAPVVFAPAAVPVLVPGPRVVSVPATPRIRINPFTLTPATVPAPVAVTPVAVQPPPVVEVRPVAVPVPAAVPETVMVTPVVPGITLYPGAGIVPVAAGSVPPAYAPPPTVVETCPTCSCPDSCGADVSSYSEYAADEGDFDYDDGTVDLLLFGTYRALFDGGDLGGMNLAVRVLLLDDLSLEAGFGYLAGATPSGGNREEAPFGLTLLWYPWDRDFPIYFGAGATVSWATVWNDALSAGGPGSWGAEQEMWFAGGRGVVGLELELFDFLLLTAEAEVFARTTVDDSVCDSSPDAPSCSEYGASANVGLGLRF
jgi:hypothetical protein